MICLRCSCGCCHVPDHGACDEFVQGFNGRCVYCDHGDACHPGQGEFHNGPLWAVERASFGGVHMSCTDSTGEDHDGRPESS